MSSVSIEGRIYGKESAVTEVDNVRAILPLPSVLQVMDVLVQDILTNFLRRAFPPVPGTFIGARPHTQALDIAHGLQSVVEKALDDKSQGAVAQMDIKAYYDSLDTLLLCRWLEEHGVPKRICATTLRLQLLPQVFLNSGAVRVLIALRTMGTLTGSRVAGALGRIPVESTICQRVAHWRSLGFQAGDHILTICAYVDNIFSAGRNLGSAISILEDFELQLLQNWGLTIKPSSRACMVPRGSLEEPANIEKWPLCATFTVLGHILADNGSTSACWEYTRRAMWRAYFANSRKCANTHCALQLLQRTVTPVFDYRNTRWPAYAELAQTIDRLQRKMVAGILRPRMQLGEAPDRYIRRRNRLATVECLRMGTWSYRHCKRILNWRDHLERPANAASWAAILLHFRGFEWLMARRSQHQGGLLGGRTGTRVASGNVSTRWHDGVLYAEQRVG